MTNLNLNEMTLEQLRTLETEIKVAKVLRKEVEKQLVIDEKMSRENTFKGNLSPNDVITFNYGKIVATGIVVRVSDKSVTVKSPDFTGAKDTNYVKYDRIVSSETPVVETPVVEEVVA